VTNKSPEAYLAKLIIAWDRATDGANTFYNQLIAEMKSADELIAKGSLAGVGKNAANQSYKGYGPGGDTQEEIRGMWSSLVALYDQVKAKITAEFIASADFDNAVPAGFDFDAPVYPILKQIFTSQAAGATVTLPDIGDLRVPLNYSATVTTA